MLVRVFTDLENYVEFETTKGYIKEILGQIKFNFGEEVSDKIAFNPHAFLVKNGDDVKVLEESVLTSDVSGNDELIVMPTTEGNEPISLTAIIGAMGMFMSTSSVGLIATMGSFIMANAAIISTVVTIGMTIGLSVLLSPDTNFGDDPARSQAKRDSNLFNSSPLVKEQGGSVPLCYGNPFCGGVLISSSLTSTDVPRK